MESVTESDEQVFEMFKTREEGTQVIHYETEDLANNKILK